MFEPPPCLSMPPFCMAKGPKSERARQPRPHVDKTCMCWVKERVLQQDLFTDEAKTPSGHQQSLISLTAKITARKQLLRRQLCYLSAHNFKSHQKRQTLQLLGPKGKKSKPPQLFRSPKPSNSLSNPPENSQKNPTCCFPPSVCLRLVTRKVQSTEKR